MTFSYTSKQSNLNREILRLAVPSIVANLTVPLVGMVDMAVAGHLRESAAAIGAISVAGVIFDVLYWSLGFLRASTGGLVAQSFGSVDYGSCVRILGRSSSLALVFAALVLLLQWPLKKVAFIIMGGSPEVMQLAAQYFSIRIWAAPAGFLLMAMRGFFVGMQDTKSSMLTDLTINAINIIVSITLSHRIGFRGIAFGSLISEYCGLAFAAITIAVKYSAFAKSSVSSAGPSDSQPASLFSMNRDLFVRSLGFMAIYFGYTAAAARYGDVMLSVSAIMMKILMIFSYFTDGFAYAGEALTGRFIGEGNGTALRQSVRGVFAWSMAIAVLFIGVYAFAGMPIVRLLTADTEVVGACRQFMWWLLLMPPLGCAAFTWDGIYEGATATRQIRNAMLCSAAVFFGVWFAGQALFGGSLSTHFGGADAIHLLMAAYFSHLFVRTVWLSVTAKKAVLGRA